MRLFSPTTLLGFVTFLCVQSLQTAVAQTEADADAVKQTMGVVEAAINGKNLDLLLSCFADDAQIDSRAAGRKVNKAEYRTAMSQALPNIESIQLRGLKVKLTGADTAIVDGESYVKLSGQYSGAYRQWKLQRRDGKWLIVDTKDK